MSIARLPFRPLALACVVALGVVPALAQDAPPVGALSCSGCHGTGPDAALPLTHLGAEDIASALSAFADGTRAGTLMPRIAKGFSAEEIAAIAAWIAEQGDE